VTYSACIAQFSLCWYSSIAKLFSGIGAIFVGCIAVLVVIVVEKEKKGTTLNEAASKPLLVLFISTVGSCNMIA
jgi:hypothetical protein